MGVAYMEKERNGEAERLAALEKVFSRASHFTVQGVSQEEHGDITGLAASYYGKAVELFDEGLLMEMKASLSSPQFLARAALLRERMLSTRKMVLERLTQMPARTPPPPPQSEPVIPLEQDDRFSLLDKLSNLFVPTHRPSPARASTSDWVTVGSSSSMSTQQVASPHPIVSISMGPPATAPRSKTAPIIPARAASASQVRTEPVPRPVLTKHVSGTSMKQSNGAAPPTPLDPSKAPELVGVDPAMQRKILDVAVDKSPGVAWEDIAGLEEAKRTLHEIVILPSLRPDLFTGLREPASGVLLFGPPGCGKTMLAKAVATEAKCAFFSISAASLMSKFLGESEGLVKALFSVARYVAPAVIFIDEIDALLSERSDKEHEASRRVKTEFLIQWDGIQAHASNEPKRILVMGATNRPQDLDEAAIRRMPQRVYIPLPDCQTRLLSVKKLMQGTKNSLSEADFVWISEQAAGYSQSDLKSFCQQAAMGPLRELSPALVLTTPADAVRGVNRADFVSALQYARPSVEGSSLTAYESWKQKFGM